MLEELEAVLHHAQNQRGKICSPSPPPSPRTSRQPQGHRRNRLSPAGAASSWRDVKTPPPSPPSAISPLTEASPMQMHVLRQACGSLVLCSRLALLMRDVAGRHSYLWTVSPACSAAATAHYSMSSPTPPTTTGWRRACCGDGLLGPGGAGSVLRLRCEIGGCLCLTCCSAVSWYVFVCFFMFV